MLECVRAMRVVAPVVLLFLSIATPASAVVRTVATVPDLGDLVRAVGGEWVDVVTLTKGPQDPHVVEPRPSFVRALHRADLLVVAGMDLEVGWLPPLLVSARNAKIQPGGRGYLDASLVIAPLQVPARGANRSQGDLHPFGNPHFLVDPVNGLRVSELVRDRLAALDPDHAVAFRERQASFARELLERLVGAELAEAYPAAELRGFIEASVTPAGLAERFGEALGGWFGRLRGVGTRQAIEEHRAWVYLARRFDLELVATLEPFDGVAPTTRHLAEVVELARRERVPLILSSAYFDARHARWVAERTEAKVVSLAHQVGARPGVESYLELLDYNLRQLTQALLGES